MTRRRISISLLLAVSQLTAPVFSRAQQPAAPVPTQQPAAATTAPQSGAIPQAGGTIHGTVKSGTIPLPGVSITATNTLTGKKYSSASDARGNYSMTIPQNGRYVLRTELAAFAPTTQEALLNA
ncbi:MAG: carboxypeptidase regulatory-like domain-containing protein, partial [Silvibacterium sp.]